MSKKIVYQIVIALAIVGPKSNQFYECCPFNDGYEGSLVATFPKLAAT